MEMDFADEAIHLEEVQLNSSFYGITSIESQM